LPEREKGIFFGDGWESVRKKRDGAQTQVKILHFASAYRSGWWCNG